MKRILIDLTSKLISSLQTSVHASQCFVKSLVQYLYMKKNLSIQTLLSHETIWNVIGTTNHFNENKIALE